MTRKRILIAIGIFLLEAVLWYQYATAEVESVTQNALLGILTSLNASIIFYVLSEFVFSNAENRNKEVDEKFETINSELKSLSDILTNANEIINNGLISIRHRDFYDTKHDFWLDVLDNAHESLNLASYTLSSWFKPEYEQRFKDAILSLLLNGKEVKIIVLDPAGKTTEILDVQLAEKIAKKAKGAQQKFQDFIATIPPSQRHLLDIRYASDAVIQYMYIRNDTTTIISPYMFVGPNSNSFLTVFRNDSQYASVFLNDFETLFRSLKPQHKSVHIENVACRHVTNTYKGHGWSFEDTTKYIFTIEKKQIEAGYFIHYKDKTKTEIVKHVIELSSSYGCPMKCRFCASSSIDNISVISFEGLFDIFTYIYQKHNLDSYDTVLLSFTGTGDFFYSYSSIINFLNKLGNNYQNIQVTVSSIFWTASNLQLATEINRLRKIQITYISHDRMKLSSVVPLMENMEYSFENVIAFIQNSSLQCFRINYLMIENLNDHSEDFQQFIELLTPIKEKVIIRISKLNETNAARINKITPAKDKKQEELCQMLQEQGFESYVFSSALNDNMNCGQLVTETDVL